MDEKETNTILKYKRPYDSWLCPECDTENDVSLGKCIACGSQRNFSSVAMLNHRTEDDEIPVTPPPKKTPPTSEPVFKETCEDDYAPKEKKNKIIWGIAIIIVVLIIVKSISSACVSDNSDDANEFNNGIYGTETEGFEELPFD